ncbi:DUF2207 domain-containing protein [Leucobacter denitrificans]|nr:DUF2207 domain-containing protein [Leucobacter denitrificans]
MTLFTAAPAQADTSDFSYDSWHVEYNIDADINGRAIAHVTETVTPRFPDFDQNRGIVRGLPIDYEGASTNPHDFTVTNGAGEPVPFEIEDEDGFRAVLVGDDSYLHGLQVFVISYTLSDVILAREDGTADEFYWDLMDFEHLQPVKEFSAEISFGPELADSLNSDARCYIGQAQSTEECSLSGSGSEADPLTISTVPLEPQEGVTVAIGLESGTVVQPSQRLPNFTLDVVPLIIGGAGLSTGLASVIVLGQTKRKRKTARGTIIAQYDVPTSLPPLLAAHIATGTRGSTIAAQIVHLAVGGAIRLEDGASGPVVRAVDTSKVADPLDKSALETLIPGADPGDAVELPSEDEAFASSMSELEAEGKSAASERGYIEQIAVPAARVLAWVSLGIAALLAAFAFIGLALRNPEIPALCLLACIVIAICAIISLVRHRAHTRLGAETREYLEGVRMFIRVAEADRIQMLQSYSGAERRSDGSVNVIHLYEKLLPYAMLFGLEKEWTEVLKTTYQATDPNYVPYWYPGLAASGIAALPSTLSQFTSSLNSSASYTSSSAGGSTGGGFAGGGGGGGFSGGR